MTPRRGLDNANQDAETPEEPSREEQQAKTYGVGIRIRGDTHRGCGYTSKEGKSAGHHDRAADPDPPRTEVKRPVGLTQDNPGNKSKGRNGKCQ